MDREDVGGVGGRSSRFQLHGENQQGFPVFHHGLQVKRKK